MTSVEKKFKRNKSKNRITKENPNWDKTWNKKFVNLKKNSEVSFIKRGQGRENIMHWRQQGRRNGYLNQRKH